MARITSKQAKEMNEAYAKVHQNLAEESARDRMRKNKERITNPFGNVTIEKEDGTKLKQGDKGFDQELEKGRKTVRDANNKSLEGRGGNSNTNTSNNTSNTQNTQKPVVKSNNNQQSTQSNNNQQSNTRPGFSSGTQQRIDALKNSANKAGVKPNEGPVTVEKGQRVDNQSSSAPNGSGGRRTGIDGKGLMDKLRSQSGDKVQPSGGQQPQSGVNRSQTVEKSTDGGTTTTRTTTNTSADNTTKAGAQAVNDFKANRETRLNRLRSGGGLRPDGQGPSTGGTPPSTQSGGQPPVQGGAQKPAPQSGGQKPGALGRLGSLAGRAANAARNAAGGIKQVATSTASNIKKGAQAVAGGIRQGAQAVSGALANKGPIQGRASGPQRRAQQAQQRTQQAQPAQQQQQQKPAAQQQAQPAQQQAQPAQQQGAKKMGSIEKQNRARLGNDKVDALKAKNAQFQAAKKSGNLAQYRKDNPKLSGAERAKAMARERIAAKKAAATPVNASYDLFDGTVQFLVSEGHAKDVSEAMSIMSESEFIDAFNQELNE